MTKLLTVLTNRRTGPAVLVHLIALMIVVQLINSLGNGFLVHFGIMPREPGSLLYIFSAPFIHASWLHLANNVLGLVVFGGICMLQGVRLFVSASAFIIILSGFAIWLLGRSGLHVGASGWIFGLWSLSIATALFRRSVMNIIVALVVVSIYGGMIVGVLPSRSMVSFEGHLFGALAGVAAAAVYARRRRD